jgi:hypothetical protein
MRGYIILCCAVCAGPTCDASNVLPDEGIKNPEKSRAPSTRQGTLSASHVITPLKSQLHPHAFRISDNAF